MSGYEIGWDKGASTKEEVGGKIKWIKKQTVDAMSVLELNLTSLDINRNIELITSAKIKYYIQD